MFIISLTYTKALSEVDQHTAGHLAFLDKYFAAGVFIVSGRKNPRIGGVIVATHTTKDELESIIQEDAFYQQGVADYDITEFVPVKSAPEFKPFLPQEK